MAQPAHLNVAFMGGRNAGSKANMEEISDKMKGEGTKRKKKAPTEHRALRFEMRAFATYMLRS